MTSLSGCITFAPRSSFDQKIEFTTILDPDDPLIRSAVLIGGMGRSDEQVVFCNGIYIEKAIILTAGHCLREEFEYFAFVPVQVKRENPYTYIRLEPAAVTRSVRHADFVFKFEDGLVENDIGLIEINLPDYHLLNTIKVLPANLTPPKPESIAWQVQRRDAFFAVAPANQVEVSGYKFERDQISRGLHLIRDTASLVGALPHTQSVLVSLNPGTSIHRGVSGSGLYWRAGHEYYLTGVVSVYYPGINLLTASDIALFRGWIDENKSVKAER